MTSPAALTGLHLGSVLDNADPDARGRVQVHLHGLDLDLWAAVVTNSAGSGYGVSLLPRQGEQVVVAFAGPDLPLVLGALWSGSSSAPDEAEPVEDRYLIETPQGTRLTFNDGEGPKLKLETKSGYHLTIDEQGGGKILIEKGGEKVELSSSGVAVTSSVKVKVDAPQVSVSASMVQVDAGMSTFSGVIKCDTLISNAVVSSSYTPGAGNVW
jgi:uncharacterized protein involved in type VI secretion and phage assembly